MATTQRKRTTTKKETVENTVNDAAIPVVTPTENDATVDEVAEKVAEKVIKKVAAASAQEKVSTSRQFNQHDLILCRSVTAGWLGCGGKSGQYYVFENFGDQCEIEYQDLFALKQRRSPYLYAPLFVIEDEELLDDPRWADIKNFYDSQVYTMDDINAILNTPVGKFENTLRALPKGLAKSLQVEVATRIENGTFDSLRKIKIIDDVFNTDFRSVLAE